MLRRHLTPGLEAMTCFAVRTAAFAAREATLTHVPGSSDGHNKAFTTPIHR